MQFIDSSQFFNIHFNAPGSWVRLLCMRAAVSKAPTRTDKPRQVVRRIIDSARECPHCLPAADWQMRARATHGTRARAPYIR